MSLSIHNEESIILNLFLTFNSYRVHIKNISAEGEVIMRIYPSAYWEPLQVKKNQTLNVEESTSVLISRDILEVFKTIFY